MSRLAGPCLALAFSLAVLAQSLTPQEMSRRAKDLMAAGRYGAAVPYYETLVKALPANPGLRLNLAMALHLSGQDARAIPEFERVLKQQPNALPALMLSGASYLRTGHPEKAVPNLEKALRLAPEDMEGRAMLADALLMLDRYQAAIPHLRKLAASAPANPRAWYGLGRSYEAVSQRAFEELEKQAQDSPWWLLLAAEARLKAGRNTAAFALYRAVLDKDPGFRGAHAGLAEVYRKTNHPEWASTEDALEKKLPPLSCATPAMACHFSQGRFEQALAMALRLKTPEALFWQSRAANQLALEAFSHLAQLPPSAESHQVMAELYRNQGRHTDAINEWKAALSLAPDDLHLKEELVTSIYMNRDYAQSAEMARALLAEDPQSPELHFILGDSLAGLQQIEQAAVPLEAAIKLRPGYLSAHAVLGRILVQLGRPAAAIPHLKAALPADTDGSLHFQLGRAYQSAGQPAQAAEIMKAYQAFRNSQEPAGEIEITPPH